MKKLLFLFSTILTVVFLTSCGSDKPKMTLIDDGNGTRSPRISKMILTQYYADGNSTEEIQEYNYNTEGLLIEKRIVVDENDTESIFYSYNKQKQRIEVTHPFGCCAGTIKRYTYGDKISSQTKLPVVDHSTYIFGFHGDGSTTKTTYIYTLNEQGEATQLASSLWHVEEILSRTRYEVAEDQHRTYHYDNTGKIIQKIDNGVVTQYSYNAFNKLHMEERENSKRRYLYDAQHLLRDVEVYRREENGEWGLFQKKTYLYENKIYYSNPAIDEDDQGQYMNSGIY